MHEQDLMPYFMEIHSDNPRGEPGRRASTTRAFQSLSERPPRPRMLDVGCGPDMQTMDLAVLTGGDITAVDTCPSYLEALDKRIADHHF